MAMRVDEVRQQRAPVQVEFAGARTGESVNVGGAADGEDTPPSDDDGLDDVVMCIDGVDVAAGEDELCCGLSSVMSCAFMGCSPIAGAWPRSAPAELITGHVIQRNLAQLPLQSGNIER